jgi:hypothetical protein
MKLEKTLKDRGSKYGNYLEQATITRKLADAIPDSFGRKAAPDQHDAVYMILVKLSRIANGDPNYADNWLDIAGYAKLVADRLTGPRMPAIQEEDSEL